MALCPCRKGIPAISRASAVTAIVFAKAPCASGIATKLTRRIGAPDATLVYHRLLTRTLRHLVRGEVDTIVAVPHDASEFAALARREGARVMMQPRGDTGHRIGVAMRHAGRAAIVVDSDAPGLDAVLVRHAAAALGFYDLVLGPTWNGGFYLVGLRTPFLAHRLFKRVRWGTSHVLEDTLAHVPYHWTVGLLPVLADTNDVASLSEAGADHTAPRRRSSSLGMISVHR